MSLSLRSALLTRFGFCHGFSLRTGGVSVGPFASLNLGRNVGDARDAVAQNHALFAREVGYADAHLYEVSQVHGARVELVDETVHPALFRAREADALVSLGRGAAVGIRVADCVPVLLADDASGAVAAVHAGWRGVVAEIVAAAVDALCAHSSARPASLLAAVFPSIGPEAFEVGEDVAGELERAVGASCVVRSPSARPHVDLARSVRLQLLGAGLSDERLDVVAGCTFRDAARFFSFRRDRGTTGRHLAAIVPRC